MDLEFLCKVKLLHSFFKKEPSHPPLARPSSMRGVARTLCVGVWTPCPWGLQNDRLPAVPFQFLCTATILQKWAGPIAGGGSARHCFHCLWPQGPATSAIGEGISIVKSHCFRKTRVASPRQEARLLLEGLLDLWLARLPRALGQRIVAAVPNTCIALIMCQAVLSVAHI